MSVKHGEFVEDIMTFLTEDDNKNPAETMDVIIAIIDDYKSELLLESTEQESKNSLSIVGETPEVSQKYTAPKANGATQRAFLLAKAKAKYYKDNNLSEQDEVNFSIAEKVQHRESINKIYYNLMTQDHAKEVDFNLKSTPLLTAGLVRRTGKEYNESLEVDPDRRNSVEGKWKREQNSKLIRDIKALQGEIELLENQNKMPRIIKSVISRNEEEIERLQRQIEDLEEKKEQYQ